MITGDIKNKVDKIWTDLWAGGITNPLTVIEQLTYLMFIRSLDEKQNEIDIEKEYVKDIKNIFPEDEEGQELRWSKFRDKDPREIFDIVTNKVFPFIKNMNGSGTAFTKYMSDAMFLIPTPQVLVKIIVGLDELYSDNDMEGQDSQGDLYEYMLSKLSTAGHNGQFRTPRHIRELMVDLVSPTPDDKICDPACGSRVIIMITADSNNGDWLSSPLLENKNMDWCAF